MKLPPNVNRKKLGRLHGPGKLQLFSSSQIESPAKELQLWQASMGSPTLPTPSLLGDAFPARSHGQSLGPSVWQVARVRSHTPRTDGVMGHCQFGATLTRNQLQELTQTGKIMVEVLGAGSPSTSYPFD